MKLKRQTSSIRRSLPWLCGLGFLVASSTWSQTNIFPATVSPESGELTASAYHEAREQEAFRLTVAIPDAVADEVADLYVANHETEQPKNESATKPQPTSTTSSVFRSIFLLTDSLLLAVLVVIRLAPPKLLNELKAKYHETFGRLTSVSGGSAYVVEKLRTEEEGVTAFFTAFQAGPRTASDPASPVDSIPEINNSSSDSPVARLALKEFQTRVAKILATQRSLLEEINRASEPAGRHKMLAALRWEMHTLKNEAGLPRLLPVWQIASALEGLLKHLTDKLGNVTASTLRTIEGSMELLNQLCLKVANPSLLTTQPIRVLVVDDNSISRNAIVRALTRAFNPPELANDTASAIALAQEKTYDVVFLDLQMRGVDGYKFSSRFHEAIPNRTTPLIFVTDQNDFDGLANSAVSTNSDLIGKPFLTFEITLKALTMALRGRLPVIVPDESAAYDTNRSDVLTPLLTETTPNFEEQVTAAGSFADSTQGSQAIALNSLLDLQDTGIPQDSTLDELNTTCLTSASAQFIPVRDLFQAVFETTDVEERQGILTEAYHRIHAFTPQANFAAVHPALQMSVALEGLLRKILENPQNVTTSTLITIATGLDLLIDLCVTGLRPDLATNPPIQMLVVDDDPVARRVVTGALQMTYKKPDCADSGAAALVLAEEKSYDVIFLDVQMPDTDGFEVCSDIRKTVLNSTTPVVFITGRDDVHERLQMSHSGGNDFMTKPVLIAEITVKALTFALRRRLETMEMVMA